MNKHKIISIFCRLLCFVLALAVTVLTAASCTGNQASSQLQSSMQEDILSQPSSQAEIESQPTEQSQPEVTVIINAGETIDDIALKLEQSGLCSAEDFKQCCKQIPGIELFSQYEPIDIRVYPVEGYLLAGEYAVSQTATAQEILDIMLEYTQSIITDDMLARAEQLDMSFDEIITLASIIQLESKHDHAMSGVSAVFHSRLNSPDYPNLQSDMTKAYADGAYDTYKVKGLPAGAICSPSLDAVNAALYPQEGLEAYYFVYDTNGEYYYAKDYDTHRENIEKLKEQGIFKLW